MQYPSNLEHWMVTSKKIIKQVVLARNTTSDCNIEEMEMK